MSLYGVFGYHVTLSAGHMIANNPIYGNTCAPTKWNTTPFKHAYLGWVLSDVINVYWPLVQIWHQCVIRIISAISDTIDIRMKEGEGGKKPSNLY